MTRFSANLGFLWNDLPLPEAICRAGKAGFDAVECHWPYDTPAEEVAAALKASGLAMLGINTAKGGPPDFGLSALPGREEEARAAIDEAIAYATAIKARNVHVMAGYGSGEIAEAVYVKNLRHAVAEAAPHHINILIEPLNRFDVPDYFLGDTSHAARIIGELDHPNLKLMFDCYHVQRTEGKLNRRLKELLPLIGHIQFASVPDRGVPNHGEVDYNSLFKFIDDLGYAEPLGAEYRPAGTTDETLGWMHELGKSGSANGEKQGAQS
jgi:hydroxypyruvate isomerase